MHNEFSSRLDVEVSEMYLKAEVAEGRHAFCRQTLVQRDRWLQLLKDSSVLGSKILLVSLRKNATKHQQLYLLCFVGNRFKHCIERALGPSRKSSKNCQKEL